MNVPNKSIIILIADDDEDDRLLAQEALEENHIKIQQLRFVEDGQELMDYLLHSGPYSDPASAPCPDLILLDLNMPRKDGREALKEIKAHPQLRLIPVVVLTTSKAEEDILKTYDLGVNSFITKPVNFQTMVKIMKRLSDYWFDIVELPSS